ncbi:GntR family transcriptional regulator [Neobacillus cucumis]|uniref:GntR family transcriptional regulator n=1 Tax=Neobacillus cucumis TaxID=1740721 RepID=UPI001965AEF2|nr:GntR family transcriptional regulator [Neobacillus cucumis]MBM7651042.1 DNA-binding GntR family transcriptional regulator [Neobacillus cucumis]
MSRPTEVAYQFIKQKIMDGIFMPSQKLVESDLSELIGVSRNTIKKALLKLEQENLVTLEENKGATIKSFSLNEIINYLEIREVLEGLIAKTAAINISDSDLIQLEETVERMKEHLNNNRFDEYSKSNLLFHNIIYEASTNEQAVEMVNKIKTQLQRLRIKTILVPGRTQESFKEHQKILNALKSKDGKWAEDAVKFHVSNVRKTIVENYSFLV